MRGAAAAARPGRPVGARAAPGRVGSYDRPMSAPATDLDTRITDAFLLGFAVHDLARLRWNATHNPANPNRFDVNTLSHARRLLDHRDRWVTMPNNDTLYSIAWLDLSAGPVRLSYPAMGERYFSFAFLDPFTDNVACVSRRTVGGAARTLWITPPGWVGETPAGTHPLPLPANDLWLLGRVLVCDADDLPAVHALQDAMRLDAPPVSRPWATAPAERDPKAFLAFACEALGRSPIPARDAAAFARAASVGLVPGATAPWDALDEATRDAWTRLMPEQLQRLRRPDPARRAAIGGGWNAGLDHIGRFGDDHAYRAAIALVGIGALPRDEAIYATTGTDADGHRLDGAHRYRLHVPADLPVGGFWSLSIYRFEADGRGFFVDNPIDRYTIGDRTPGLQREPDGSILLTLQHAAPQERPGNWLPTPEGRFGLAWRLYEPGAPLLERRHALTGAVRLDR
jgi:hypothetical protein